MARGKDGAKLFFFKTQRALTVAVSAFSLKVIYN